MRHHDHGSDIRPGLFIYGLAVAIAAASILGVAHRHFHPCLEVLDGGNIEKAKATGQYDTLPP